ncbi:hypothetical protein SPI_08750 [Niveomyces insectorum RCEF 264]|uniref:Uncharacterized protein n=1 Tax=Niveomyces insectorum RCEF 264 TaxID=1081102 RepID=A0A167MLJ7_9HYPO|nr:hypothetical protein SPI_08750 [Niveomyces insectorum RCEF 264]
MPYDGHHRRKGMWSKLRFPFITDVAGLKQYIDTNDDAVFVALDIEGSPAISELAISVLPPSALRRLVSGEKPPADVNDLAAEYRLDTHSFRVNGKHNVTYNTRYRRSILQFGELQWVDEDALTEAVTAKLLSLWHHYAAAGPTADGRTPTRPLVLTGFHAGTEAYYFARGLHPVVQAVPFAAYVDIQDILVSMSTARGKLTPSLQLSMRTAGLYLRETTTVEQVAAGQFADLSRRRQMSHERRAAGNDVVCELSLLAHIVAHVLYDDRGSPTAKGRPQPPTNTPVPRPLLDRLRLLVEGMIKTKPVWPGPTEEETIRNNAIRAHRLLKKQARENTVENPDLPRTGMLASHGERETD